MWVDANSYVADRSSPLASSESRETSTAHPAETSTAHPAVAASLERVVLGETVPAGYVVAAVDTNGNGMVSWDEILEGQQELRKWKQKRKPKSRRNGSPQPLRASDKPASTTSSETGW